MICKGCGAEIESNQMYCPRCGTKNELSYQMQGQVPVNQVPPTPNQNYSNTAAPNQSAPMQMPPYQMPGQVSPGPMPGQIPGQVPPGPMPGPMGAMPGPMPQGPMSPNMMPPYAAMPAVKKKNPIIFVVIAVAAVIFLLIAGIVIVNIVNGLDKTKYETFNYYIDGRELSEFDLNTDIYMENGIAFYLGDIMATDQGDGTKLVECSVQLGASYSDTYLYYDDFIVMPEKKNGDPIADAIISSSIKDADGYDLSAPVLLDTEYFYDYTISFSVPSDTEYFRFFGANFELDSSSNEPVSSGPVYYVDIQLQ